MRQPLVFFSRVAPPHRAFLRLQPPELRVCPVDVLDKVPPPVNDLAAPPHRASVGHIGQHVQVLKVSPDLLLYGGAAEQAGESGLCLGHVGGAVGVVVRLGEEGRICGFGRREVTDECCCW